MRHLCWNIKGVPNYGKVNELRSTEAYPKIIIKSNYKTLKPVEKEEEKNPGTVIAVSYLLS